MKKILGNKIALLLIGALIVGFGGTFLYLSKTKPPKKEETKQDEGKKETTTTTLQTEKGAGLNQTTTTTTVAQKTEDKPPESTENLGKLSVSLTAQKSATDETISLIFYPEGSGIYTTQEKSGGIWVTVKDNQSYSGRGGLDGAGLAAGQASKTVRILKVEGGKYSLASKEFTVSRAEVEAALGIKTYN